MGLNLKSARNQVNLWTTRIDCGADTFKDCTTYKKPIFKTTNPSFLKNLQIFHVA